MLKFINNILVQFRAAFSRASTFEWFVLTVMGFLIRPDFLGITSIMRAFNLYGLAYKCLRDFFRSEAYDVRDIQRKWCAVLAKAAPIYKINGRNVLAGDGSLRSTEGKFQPGQGKQHSESNNQSRPESFIGQLYGCVCVLAGAGDSILGIPLFFTLQKGVRMLSVWKGHDYYKHPQRVLLDAFEAAMVLGPSLLVLDRGFPSKGLLKLFKELINEGRKGLVELVMRFRIDTIAFEEPGPQPEGKRGRKPKKGKKVKLMEYFEKATGFTSAKLKLYGKKEKVSYRAVNLLWREGLYFPIRFVLVRRLDGSKMILGTTDLSMNPEDVIVAYARRFKIEQAFRTFKQTFGGLSHHFWTKALGLAFSKSRSSDELMSLIEDPKARERVEKTVKAMDAFTTCASIAMGLAQLLCLKMPRSSKIRLPYQRTRKESAYSEGEIRSLLQLNLTDLINADPDLTVSRVIMNVKERYSGPESGPGLPSTQKVA